MANPVYEMFPLTAPKPDPLMVFVRVNEVELPMEIDTGASISIISEKTYLSTWPDEPHPCLLPSKARLRTYTGEMLHVCGCINVSVFYRGQKEQLSLQVVQGAGSTLLGRDWLKRIKLNWKELNYVNSVFQTSNLQSVLNDYSDVFKDELGLMRDIKISLQVVPDAQPRYHRPDPIPYAMRSRVDAELDRLEKGVIEPVAHSEWAEPIVPVVKRDGSICICGDF